MKTFQELYANHPTIESGAPFICVTEQLLSELRKEALLEAAEIAMGCKYDEMHNMMTAREMYISVGAETAAEAILTRAKEI